MSHLENNKRLARNTVMLYIRMLFIMAVTLYTSRIILQVLGIEDFGIYNVVAGVVLMFGFLNNAMTAAVQRFVSFELGRNDVRRLHTIFSMSVSIHILLAVLVLLLAETVGLYVIYSYLTIPEERMFAALVIYQCALISFAVSILQVPYMSCIIAHEKMDIYAIGTILDCCSKLIGVYLLTILTGDKLIWYGIILLVISIMVAVFYRTYAIKTFSECHYEFIWDKSLFSKMITYSGWSLFGGVATVGAMQGVNILLNIFFGPAVNAARGIAYQVNSAVSSLYSSFTQAVNPQIIKQYSAGNLDYTQQLIFRSCRFTYLLVLLFACPIFFETGRILELWLGVIPEHAMTFCRLVLISTLIDCISMPLVPAVNATGKIKKYQIVVGNLLIMNLPVSYILLDITDKPEVSFYVAIAISVLTTSARLWICHSLLKFPIINFIKSVFGKIIPTTILSISPMLLYRYVNDLNLLANLCVCLFIVLLSIWFMGLENGEKEMVKNKLIKTIKRNG